MKPKIAYFTNIAPHYREKLWLALANDLGVEFHFYFGYKPGQSIKSIDFTSEQWKDLKDQIHLIENIEVNNVLIYQSKVIREILFNKWDAIILLGHARIFTVWIAAVVARLKGIPVILWGHGLYGSERFLKRNFLKSFLSLAKIVLVYGEFAKKLMIEQNFKENNIKVIYNSINYDESKKYRDKYLSKNYFQPYFDNTFKTLIFIGRMTKIKKLHLLIESISKLNSHKEKYNLIIIGEGEDRPRLELVSKKLGINTYFYGECYSEKKIAELLSNADLCVSPGNVGLTGIHAMSYGTPVCTHNDFTNQMPEFEAVIPWETGCFYDKKSLNIAEIIQKWFEKSPDRQIVRENCYKIIDAKYNQDYQLKVLKDAINSIEKKDKRG